MGDDDGQPGAIPGGDAGSDRGAHRLVDDLGEGRVPLGVLGQLQLDDAALASVRGGDRGGAAQRLGRHLGPQADGDRGHALIHCTPQQGAQVGEPGVSGVVVRAHGPAQDDEPAADLGQVGDRVPGPGPHHAQDGSLGEEPFAQAPQRRKSLGLNHGDDRSGCGRSAPLGLGVASSRRHRG